MAESTSYLCPFCDRSKRPKLDLAVDFLVKFEKFQLKSFESNALQMFVNRALDWNERFDKLVSECTEIKKLFDMTESRRSVEASELGKYFLILILNYLFFQPLSNKHKNLFFIFLI